ncbi:MAG: DUF1570 domain-containing protein [Planctomycetaceae bacterium]
MRRNWFLLLILSFWTCAPTTQLARAAEPILVELTVTQGDGSEKVFQGKSLAHDKTRCLLMQRNGELADITLANVKSFRQAAPVFRPIPLVQVRDDLRNEYRGQLEVVAAGPFVVCGPAGTVAPMAALVEEVHDAFRRFFTRRQFRLEPLEFPLVVMVFPSRSDFEKYATADMGDVPSTMRGYYSSRTNRTALYVDQPKRVTGSQSGSVGTATALGGTSDAATVTGTLIHEAIHQLAYNYGLHSRISETPRWLSEGLAMLMEEESMLHDTGAGSAQQRINRPRLLRFQQFSGTRRPAQLLSTFVASNESFESMDLLDSYSEAWALSFYLAENRPQDYARYLKQVAGRSPSERLSPSEQLAEFQSYFGQDLKVFESRYLTFIKGLRLDKVAAR